MAQKQKDVQIYLSEKERITVQEIITLLASVETILAHNPDWVPLDVFLNYSGFVHKWYDFYTNDLYRLNPVSHLKYNQLVLRLKYWQIDFKNNLSEIDNSGYLLLTQAVQKANNLYIQFTVGQCVDSESSKS